MDAWARVTAADADRAEGEGEDAPPRRSPQFEPSGGAGDRAQDDRDPREEGSLVVRAEEGDRGVFGPTRGGGDQGASDRGDGARRWRDGECRELAEAA